MQTDFSRLSYSPRNFLNSWHPVRKSKFSTCAETGYCSFKPFCSGQFLLSPRRPLLRDSTSYSYWTHQVLILIPTKKRKRNHHHHHHHQHNNYDYPSPTASDRSMIFLLSNSGIVTKTSYCQGYFSFSYLLIEQSDRQFQTCMLRCTKQTMTPTVCVF